MNCQCKSEECDCHSLHFIGIEKEFYGDKFSMEYLELKKRQGFKKLLIRLGDYYESFFADAEELPTFTGIPAVQRERGVLIAGFKASDLLKYRSDLESRGWELIEDFRN